jgi:signal transduction histidine kinase
VSGPAGARRARVRLLAGLAVLWALWAYAALAAGDGAADTFRARALGEHVGQPVDAVILALQEERRAPADAAARARTDEAYARLRRSAGGAWAGWSAGTEVRVRVDALLTGLRRLPDLRAGADAAGYTDLIDTAFQVYANPRWDDPHLARNTSALVALSRVREFVAREDALVRGPLAAGGLDPERRTALARLVGAQRQVRADAEAALDGGDRSRYRAAGARFAALRTLEDQLVRPDAPPVTALAWADAVNPVLAALRDMVLAGARDAVRQVTPAAIVSIVRAGLVGGLGLVAVIALFVLGLRQARTLAARSVDGPGAAPAAPATGPGPATRDSALPALLLDLNRRNQTLLHRQLRVLDGMERRESDDEHLGDLFRADHLATRIRRNVEKAIALAGGTPGRRWRRPVPMVDVIRAAASEVADYPRVAASPIEPAGLAGPAVADVTHLLAELIENATSFSPAQTRIRVTGERCADGYAVTVTDTGVGMPADDLATAREVMADPLPPPGGAWWGLYAVGRFADRHGIAVDLTTMPNGGLAARVLVPPSLVAPPEPADETDPAEPTAPAAPPADSGGARHGRASAPGGRPGRPRVGQPVDRVARLRGRVRAAAETIELPVTPAGPDDRDVRPPGS